VNKGSGFGLYLVVVPIKSQTPSIKLEVSGVPPEADQVSGKRNKKAET
jgi:hypothetical protein